jgi:hypothetical protein
MKITIEPTTQLCEISSHETDAPLTARVWIGHTDKGTPVQVIVACVTVATPHAEAELLAELTSAAAPRPEPPPFPLRMIL